MNSKDRPRRDGGKTERINIRMSKEDLEKLDYTAEKMGISRAELIRKGITAQYNLAKYSD